MRTFAAQRLLVAATLWAAAFAVFPTHAGAQTTPSAAPTLIPVSGELRMPDGSPRAGAVVLVLSLYEVQNDPAPRWVEHQTVTLDATGRYNVQFGATRTDGLPPDLFGGATGLRWLGVAVENEAEQPRVPLISVPYAANAVSADTLAGKPATDFVLTSNLQNDVRAVLQQEGVTSGSNTAAAVAGTLNYLQKGDGAAGTTDSNVFEIGGNVGIGTTSPSALFSVGAGNLFQVSSSGVFRASGFGEHRLGGAGTGAGTVWLTLAGHSGAAAGSFIRFQRNLTDVGFVGSLATILGGASTTNAMTMYGDHADGLDIRAANASGAIKFSVAGPERMRIDAAGNVGIGTTAPTAKLHIAGDIRVDGNIAAKYQDVAEWVDSTGPLDAGTVVVIDKTGRNRVMSSARAYDSGVAGAVSPQPGLILGEPGEGKVLVAQSGRVRVKADASNGAIKPGDLLVTSPRAGYAMKSTAVKMGAASVHRPGTVVGKALEPLAKGTGEILVLLTLQ
jgi:hypothetical protein